MNGTSSVTMACLCLGLAGAVLAQDQEGAATGVEDAADQIVGIGTVSQVYERWAGSDGELSVSEWDAAVDQLFGEEEVNLPVARWDADTDGTITLEEFTNAITQTQIFQLYAGDPKVSVNFAAWDRNGDGQLSQDEWDGKIDEEGLFANFDSNEDGVLSGDELDDDFFVWDMGETDRDGDNSIAAGEFREGLFNTYDEDNSDILEEGEFDVFGRDVSAAGLSDV